MKCQFLFHKIIGNLAEFFSNQRGSGALGLAVALTLAWGAYMASSLDEKPQEVNATAQLLANSLKLVSGSSPIDPNVDIREMDDTYKQMLETPGSLAYTGNSKNLSVISEGIQSLSNTAIPKMGPGGIGKAGQPAACSIWVAPSTAKPGEFVTVTISIPGSFQSKIGLVTGSLSTGAGFSVPTTGGDYVFSVPSTEISIRSINISFQAFLAEGGDIACSGATVLIVEPPRPDDGSTQDGCAKGAKKCPGHSSCVPDDYICCGNNICTSWEVCCEQECFPRGYHCCERGLIAACRGECCDSGCCSLNQKCCNGRRCCDEGEICCPGGYCCPADSKCSIAEPDGCKHPPIPAAGIFVLDDLGSALAGLKMCLGWDNTIILAPLDSLCCDYRDSVIPETPDFCNSDEKCCAMRCCPRKYTCCNDSCCKDNETCCYHFDYDYLRGYNTCCPPKTHCCETGCCPDETPPAGGSTGGNCANCEPGHTCCGDDCCEENETCCDGMACCPPDYPLCCEGSCCPPDYHCCGSFCCPKDSYCCNDGCCFER